MTLAEAMTRLKTSPKKGDHEIVRSATPTHPDRLAHLAVVVDVLPPTSAHRMRVDFQVVCGALPSHGPEDLEIAESITCMKCMTW